MANEAFDIVSRNDSLEALEKSLRIFLSEDSIIKRTRDCNKYFDEFVTPLGELNQVNCNLRDSWLLIKEMLSG